MIHGENGILVPPGEPEALADGIQHLVDAPHTWEAMGKRGREVVTAKYELTQLNRKFERMCLQLTARACL